MKFNILNTVIITISVFCVAGCGSIPKYCAEESTSREVCAPREDIVLAVNEALDMLGCKKISKEKNNLKFKGERSFILGFFCGSGGEDVKIEIVNVDKKNNLYKLKISFFKRTPYYVAPRFRNKEFIAYFLLVLKENQKRFSIDA